MLRNMFTPMESLPDEEEEETEDNEGTDTASVEGIDESSDSGILSPDMPPSRAHTRSHGKAKKAKD